MHGFIIKTDDCEFMCDLIDFLSNYQIDKTKEYLVMESSDIDQYFDAREFISDHDYEESFTEYRNRNKKPEAY